MEFQEREGRSRSEDAHNGLFQNELNVLKEEFLSGRRALKAKESWERFTSLRDLQQERLKYRSESASQKQKESSRNNEQIEWGMGTDAESSRKIKEIESQWEYIKRNLSTPGKSTPTTTIGDGDQSFASFLNRSTTTTTLDKEKAKCPTFGINKGNFNSLLHLKMSLGKLRSISEKNIIKCPKRSQEGTFNFPMREDVKRQIVQSRSQENTVQLSSSFVKYWGHIYIYIYIFRSQNSMTNIFDGFQGEEHSTNNEIMTPSSGEIAYRKKIYIPHKIIHLNGPINPSISKEFTRVMTPNASVTKVSAPKYILYIYIYI